MATKNEKTISALEGLRELFSRSVDEIDQLIEEMEEEDEDEEEIYDPGSEEEELDDEDQRFLNRK